jgi:hypothetical protein
VAVLLSSASVEVSVPLIVAPSLTDCAVVYVATGASLEPVTVIVKLSASLPPLPSLTRYCTVTNWLAPAAKLWYAAFVGSNDQMPFVPIDRPAIALPTSAYVAPSFVSASVRVN